MVLQVVLIAASCVLLLFGFVLIVATKKPTPVAPTQPLTDLRCHLGPSRVRFLSGPVSGDAFRKVMSLCALEQYGCIMDNIGATYVREEPEQIICLAEGDGRR